MLNRRPMPLNRRVAVLILLAFSNRTLPRSGFVLRPQADSSMVSAQSPSWVESTKSWATLWRTVMLLREAVFSIALKPTCLCRACTKTARRDQSPK